MKSFIDFLLERAKGSVKYDKADLGYIQNELKYMSSRNIPGKIRAIKDQYIAALQQANVEKAELLKNMTLPELKAKMDAHDIKISPRKQDWKKHEQDVIAGINVLFQSGFYQDGQKQPLHLDAEKVYAEGIGGATHSDVKVVAYGKEFYVECKLNFDSAEYFKYGVSINGDKIVYNHKKYLADLGKTTDKAEIDKINQLFSKNINIGSFLNSIVNSKELVDSWKLFHKNVQDVEQFVLVSKEFSAFSKDIQFKNVYPDDFQAFVKVYDGYCDFYIEKYNTLIEQLFKLFDNDVGLDINDFKILSHKENSKANVFKKTALLKALAEGQQIKVHDQSKFNILLSAIEKIEIKLNVLLQTLGYDSNQINKVKSLPNSDKAKYFFKMFISSVGRKQRDAIANSLTKVDELGNMEICNLSNFKSAELAKLITNFYVKKDNCQYIQIADTIYQLDKKLNSLSLPDLPLFTDYLTSFSIKLSINDDLDHIGLHIKALEPDKVLLSKRKLLSFKKDDANYISKAIRHITLKI